MENKNYHRITVADMAPHVHSFLSGENKVNKIFHWLKNWIDLSLDCGKIKPYDMLPLKADLACHIGVSQGTIQTVFRLLEDEGYVESKQRIGTYIKHGKNLKTLEKLTSKRELTIEILKKYIAESNISVGEKLPSGRKIALELGISVTTLRLGLNYLVKIGVLNQTGKNYYIANLSYDVELVESKTLVDKIVISLKKYISENYEIGDKIPTNKKLSIKFNVSIKTMHDAIKHLVKEGFLFARRGQYGTIYLGEGDSDIKNVQYCYEKYEQKIRKYILENHKVEDKLPTLKEFAKLFNTSEKTIKKALSNLAEEGYIAFSRGRYGGTFVLDIPTESAEAYQWLAITPEYIENLDN